MRRLFPNEPSISPPPQLLHPVLQAALSSLDVQLETELTRYRRQRVGKAKRGRTKQRISLDTAAETHNRQPAEMLAIGAIGGRSQSLPSSAVASNLSTERVEPLDTLDRDPWQPENQYDEISRAIASPRASVTSPDNVAKYQPSTALNLSSAPPETNADAEVDNYFASSEELLRSLSEEEAELRSQQDPRLLESLLTPLGIGSLLLLLLSSITIGYLILNPASFNAIDRLLSRPPSVSTEPPSPTGDVSLASPSNGSTSPDLSAEEFKDVNVDTLPMLPKTSPTVAPVAPTASPTVSATVTPEPTSDSAADPGSISGIAEQRSSRPTATASPARVAAPAPARATTPRRSNRVVDSARSSSNRSSTPVRRRAPQAENSTQATNPSRPRRSAATTSSPPSSPIRSTPRSIEPSPDSRVATRSTATQTADSGHYYYVISNYSGDRSLEQARQAVGDAYVRNFPNGARVQLGAFSDESRARELAQQLAQQGVSAQVYNP